MEGLKIITSNYLINVGVLSWFCAQVLKTILTYLDTNTLDLERMVGAGGMPSAHSALVCSLAIGMARKMGYSSPEFALALALAGIVMYDAMGVRRAAGEQAKLLNKMVSGFKIHAEVLWNDLAFNKELGDDDPLTDDEIQEENKELKEYLGHTPLEVLGGALLGILVAVLVPVI